MQNIPQGTRLQPEEPTYLNQTIASNGSPKSTHPAPQNEQPRTSRNPRKLWDRAKRIFVQSWWTRKSSSRSIVPRRIQKPSRNRRWKSLSSVEANFRHCIQHSYSRSILVAFSSPYYRHHNWWQQGPSYFHPRENRQERQTLQNVQVLHDVHWYWRSSWGTCTPQ